MPEPAGAVPPEQPDLDGLTTNRAEIQQRAVHGAIWTLVNIGVSMPVAFGVNLVLARVLGVVDYGRLAFLTAVMQIAGILVSAGMSSALIQFGSKAHAAGRSADVQRLLSLVQGYRLMVSTPVVALALTLLAHVDAWLLVSALVFGVLVPGALSTAVDCLWVENRPATGAKLTLIGGLVTQAAVVTALLVFRSADAVWLARIGMGGLDALLNLLVINRAYRRAVIRPRVPRGFPAGWWAFALPTAVSTLVATLVTSRSEVFLLQWLGKAADVGLFALAYGLSTHLFAPAQSLVGPLIPAISSLRTVDLDAVGNAFLRTLRTGATVSGLVVATAMPALAALVPILYGDEFRAAVPLMVALSAAGAVLIVSGPATAFVTARLRSRFLLAANLAGLAVDVLVAVLTIPVWGAWGAVAANVAAALTTTVVVVNSERAGLGMRPGTVLRSILPAAIGALSGAVAYLASREIDSPWMASLAAAAFGAALFLLGLRVARVGLAPLDRAALVGVLPPRGRAIASPLLGWLGGKTEEPS